ncbi:unnamed protein product [Phyllotreta striolata]|uniref:Major facilitator superfamily (MFS) profile domain-containing protein n=1 Tax=Phyllotreta striolata TaxID=444603 RepID=A0A9N9TCY0_PHYSR|nr:unnamed protein product [Phyllotreta striolata]
MAKAKIAKKEEARLKEELQAQEKDQGNIPAPPDGGYGWVIVAASFVCNMVADGVGYSFGILLPALVEYYGSSKGTTAWVGSIMAGSMLGAGPIISAIVNKFGCRVTCLAGCIISSVALGLSIYSPSISVLMLVYGFVGGVGYGFIYLPAVVMVGYYFESKRSLATGISVCGSGVGTFTFAPLANYVLSSYGWKTTVLVLAVISLSCSVFALLMKPLSYDEPPAEETVEEGKPQSKSVPLTRFSEGNISNPYNSSLSISKRKNSIQPLARKDVFYASSIQNLKEFQSRTSLAEYRNSVHSLSSRPKSPYEDSGSCSDTCGQLIDLSLLKDPVFSIIAVSNLFGMTAFYIPFVYLIELAKVEGIEASQAAFLISVIGIVNTIARIGIGFIADIKSVNNFHVNNSALLLAGVTTAAFTMCHSYTSFVIVSIFFGVAVAAYISLTSIILVEFMGLEKLTNAFGLTILFRGVASLIGSPMAGTLYDMTQSYNVPFFVGGALFVVAAIISASAPFFRKKKKTVDMDGEQMVPMNK